MKKLMTVIAAVAMSFGLFADATPFTISFEAAEGASGTTKGVDVSTMKFTPPAEGWTWGGDPLDMLAYDGDAYEYTTTRRTFDDQDNLNYLTLSTGSDELARTMGEGNIFVDQLVKFTGFEEPQTNLVAGTKIAVWMSGTETDETVVGETNLYVTVGQVDADGKLVKQVAFAIDNPADGAEWKTEKWYRLTIKSIGNIFEGSQLDARAGFIVYIDGVQVASSDDAAKTLVAATGDLTTAAAGYMAKGQLFPAIDNENAVFNSVAYKGIGAIDDVVLDDQGPDFCQFVNVTVTEIPGAVIAVSQNGEEIKKGEDGKYAVAPGEFKVTYTADKDYILTPVVKTHDTAKLKDNTVNDSADVEPKEVIVEVSYNLGEAEKYADEQVALAEVAVYTKANPGKQVDIKFVQAVTKEAYAFDEGTMITITDSYDVEDPDAQLYSYWNIKNGDVTFKTGLENNKWVTLEGSAYTLTFAGTMKDGSNIDAENIVAAGTISLEGSAAIQTLTTSDIAKSIEVPEGFKLKADVEGDYVTYFAEAFYLTVTADETTTGYLSDELEQALADVQAAVAAGKEVVVTPCTEDGLFFENDGRSMAIDYGTTITIPNEGQWIFNGVLTYNGAIDGAVTATDIEKFDLEGAEVITLNLTGTVTVGEDAMATKELFTCGAGDDYEVVKEGNTFKVQPKAPETYEITIDSAIVNGEVTVDKAEAAAGETVEVTAKPATGYELATITTNGQALAKGETTFVMPAEEVVVSATFTAIEYAITIDANGGEGGSADPAVVTVANTYPLAITLTTPTAPENKEFDKWECAAGEIEGNTLTLAECPSAAVTVTATYKDKQQDWPQEGDPTIIDKKASEAFEGKIPTELANVPAQKFTVWAQKAGLDFANCKPADVNVDAYLLDCTPDEVVAEKAKAVSAITITSIEFVNGEWVITSGTYSENSAYGANAKVHFEKVTIGGADTENAEFWQATLVPDETPAN